MLRWAGGDGSTRRLAAAVGGGARSRLEPIGHRPVRAPDACIAGTGVLAAAIEHAPAVRSVRGLHLVHRACRKPGPLPSATTISIGMASGAALEAGPAGVRGTVVGQDIPLAAEDFGRARTNDGKQPEEISRRRRWRKAGTRPVLPRRICHCASRCCLITTVWWLTRSQRWVFMGRLQDEFCRSHRKWLGNFLRRSSEVLMRCSCSTPRSGRKLPEARLPCRCRCRAGGKFRLSGRYVRFSTAGMRWSPG